MSLTDSIAELVPATKTTRDLSTIVAEFLPDSNFGQGGKFGESGGGGSWEPTITEYPIEFGKSVPRGALNTGISMAGGTAQAAIEARNPESLLSGALRIAQHTSMGRKFGTMPQDAAEFLDENAAARRPLDGDVIELINEITKGGQAAVEQAIPVTPGFEDSWTRQIGEGLGSAIPAAVAYAAGGAPLISMTGGAAAYNNTYRIVRELTDDKQAARDFAKISSLVTAAAEPASSIPRAFKIFERLNGATAGWVGKELAKASGAEALTEIIEEIPDEIARQSYIDERKLIDSLITLAETGIVGGTVGAIFGGTALAIKAKVDRNNAKLLADHQSRIEAGQADPIPNKQAFKDAGYPDLSRKERSAEIDKLKDGEVEIPAQPAIPEGDVPPDISFPVQGATNAQEVQTEAIGPSGTEGQAQGKGQEAAEVNDVLGTATSNVATATPDVAKSIPPPAETRQSATPATKQPWEMTRKQFDKANFYQHNILRDDATEIGPEGFREGIGPNVVLATRGQPLTIMEQRYGTKAGRPIYLVPKSAIKDTRNGPKIKEGWKPNPEDKLVPRYDYQPVHEMLVERAIAEGKPVPPKVLADYPNLVAKVKPETKQEPPAGPEKPPSVPAGETSTTEVPEGATSIKNAVVDRERAASGQVPLVTPDVFTDQQAVDEAAARLAENPSAGAELVESLKSNPRAMTKEDDALLLTHKRAVMNRQKRVLQRLIEAQDAGDPVAQSELEREAELIATHRIDIDEAGKLGGTITARGLQARKMMMEEDFSLEHMVMEKRAAVGRPLTTQEQVDIAAQSRAILELQKKLDDAASRIESLEAEKAVKTVEKVVKKQRATRAESARKELSDALNDLGKWANKPLSSNPFLKYPALAVDVAKVAKAYAKLGVAKFQDFFDSVAGKLGKQTAENIRDLLEESWRQAIEETKPKAGKRQLGKQASLNRFAHDLAEFFVSQGINEREALIDAVHGELVKAVPGVTRRQTMDAISGYGQYKALNKEQISAELRDLKGQMQQVGKLEDMASGIAPSKTGVERRTPSDAERELIAQVNEAKKKGGYVVTDPEKQLKSALSAIETRLKNQISDLQRQIDKGERAIRKKTPVPTNERIEALKERRDELKSQLDDLVGKPGQTDAQRLSAYKSRTRSRIDELETRLSRGDFSKKERKPITLDAEGERLRFELEKTKINWLKGLEDDRRARRSTPKKLWEGVKETLNTSRAIMTSFDLSAVGRQGGILVAAHPKLAKDAMSDMFKSFASEAAFSKSENEIANRPNSALYRRSKLALTSIHDKLTKMEEAYMSRWAKKIPGVSHSERAYVAFLNRIRADVFDALVATLGKDGSVTDSEAKIIANYVNVATGRGDLGKAAAAAEVLATAFFSPRYVLSRFQFLTAQPLRKGLIDGEGSWRVRKLIAKEYARSLAGLGLFYGTMGLALSALIGPPGDDKKWNVEFDPRSSDFGKIRIGQTRIDPLAGLQQATVLLSRIITGKTKTLKGKVVPIRGEKVPFGTGNTADTIARFLRTKLSPAIGSVIDIATGRDVIGDPVTVSGEAIDAAIPLSFREIYQTMKEQGVPAGTALGILNLFGVGVQTYEERTKKKAG